MRTDASRPWRLWLASGMGEVVSQELASAMTGCNGAERRRARKLVRHGEAAEDVAVARYVVAFARERQRRSKRSSFWLGVALGAVFGVAGIGFVVYLLRRSEQAQAVVMAGVSAVVLLNVWRTWQTIRHAQTAERLNREYLRRAGAPYLPGGPPTRLHVPPLAFACSLAIHAAAMFVVGGVLAISLKADSLASAKALPTGISGGATAAVAAVIGAIWARSREDEADGAEHQPRPDLD